MNGLIFIKFQYNLAKTLNMLSNELKKSVVNYPDFPKGILFRDVSPILKNPYLLNELIDSMSSYSSELNADGIVAIDNISFLEVCWL